jgi:WD40 repeat protein
LNCIAFSPEGSLLASAEAIWDVETGEQVQTLETGLIEVGHVAFSPDGVLGLWDKYKARRDENRDPLLSGGR